MTLSDGSKFCNPLCPDTYLLVPMQKPPVDRDHTHRIWQHKAEEHKEKGRLEGWDPQGQYLYDLYMIMCGECTLSLPLFLGPGCTPPPRCSGLSSPHLNAFATLHLYLPHTALLVMILLPLRCLPPSQNHLMHRTRYQTSTDCQKSSLTKQSATTGPTMPNEAEGLKLKVTKY